MQMYGNFHNFPYPYDSALIVFVGDIMTPVRFQPFKSWLHLRKPCQGRRQKPRRTAVLEAQKAAFFWAAVFFLGCEVKNLPTSDVQRPRTQIVDINVY